MVDLSYFVNESLKINNNKDFYETFNFRVYDGKDGCKRLALSLKEYIYRNNIHIDIKDTYSQVCCIFYSLNPPLNANEWNKLIGGN